MKFVLKTHTNIIRILYVLPYEKNSYEIRILRTGNSIRISYEFLYEFHTKRRIRITYELHTNYIRIIYENFV